MTLSTPTAINFGVTIGSDAGCRKKNDAQTMIAEVLLPVSLLVIEQTITTAFLMASRIPSEREEWPLFFGLIKPTQKTFRKGNAYALQSLVNNTRLPEIGLKKCTCAHSAGFGRYASF